MSKKFSVERRLMLCWQLALVATALFSLSAPAANTIYLYLLLYALVFWQRQKLSTFLRLNTQAPAAIFGLYLVLGIMGAMAFELTLTQLPFHPNPLVDILIGLGFYLPYFALWYKLINRYKLNFLEVFYLGGVSRVIFAAVVTHKLFLSPGLVGFAARTVATFALFGALTSLPYVLLLKQEKEELGERPLKEYIIGLSPGFIAAVMLLVWIGVLKLLITKALQL